MCPPNNIPDDLEAKLQAIREKDIAEVSKKLGISDPALAAEIVNLGFGAEEVPCFPLIPLVYVAWADGDVSNKERFHILSLAQARGINEGDRAHTFLTELLEKRPADSFLDTTVDIIRRMYEQFSDTKANQAKQDLVSLCYEIASASGGFLGLWGDKVSSEERATIREIIDLLGDKESAAALMDKLR